MSAEKARLDRNRELVIRHFDEFVNKKDLDAVLRNMTEDFFVHDGHGGQPTDRAGDRAMMEALHTALPDLRVEVLDVLPRETRSWSATGGRAPKRERVDPWSSTASCSGAWTATRSQNAGRR